MTLRTKKVLRGVLPHPGALQAQVVVAVTVLVSSIRPAVALSTTTTTYQYNADGELTALTRTSSRGSNTTYLTWDNFVPSAVDPTTGSVAVGNGTLAAVGPVPGLPAQYEYDVRQRLVGYTDGNLIESIDYHANGDLRSTEAGGDARRFYFDRSENAEIMNIHQSGQDLWSGMLDHVRYLSDGTEQVLLQPRKDMAAKALNPRGLLTGAEFQQRLIDEEWSSSPQTAKYKRWTNNCHSHAYGVLKLLEFQ